MDEFFEETDVKEAQQSYGLESWQNLLTESKESNSYLGERFELYFKNHQKCKENPQVVDILVQFLVEIQVLVKRQFILETTAVFLMFIEVINEHGHDFIFNEQEMDKKSISK